MDLFQALGLGVLQGVTEFLPVSSSGHLRIVEQLLGVTEPDLLFDVVLHLGTLVAVFLVYRRDLWMLAADGLRALGALLRGQGWRAALAFEGARLLLLLGIASIPTGLIGLLLKRWVESPLFTLPVVGGLLILNGALLLLSRRAPAGSPPSPPTPEAPTPALRLWNIGVSSALLVGVMQGVAVLPGISRAGMTITTALWLRVERQEAARYSFLLSIPAILGALVLNIPDALAQPWEAEEIKLFGAGALASVVVGWLSLMFLLQLLRRASFHHFAWYCFGLGAAAVALGLHNPG